MSNYSDLLKDPRWQKKRLAIFERDQWTCQFCWSKTKTLHLHHVDYVSGKPPWECPDDYLLTLCDDCHGKEEDLKSSNPSLARHASLAKISVLKLHALLFSFVFLQNKNPEEFKKIIDTLDGACRGENYNEFVDFINTAYK